MPRGAGDCTQVVWPELMLNPYSERNRPMPEPINDELEVAGKGAACAEGKLNEDMIATVTEKI